MLNNQPLRVYVPLSERPRYTALLRDELLLQCNDSTIADDSEAIDYIYLTIASDITRSLMIDEIDSLLNDRQLAECVVTSLYNVFEPLATKQHHTQHNNQSYNTQRNDNRQRQQYNDDHAQPPPHSDDVRDIRYKRGADPISHTDATEPKRKKLLVVTKRQQQESRTDDRRYDDSKHDNIDDISYNDIVQHNQQIDDSTTSTSNTSTNDHNQSTTTSTSTSTPSTATTQPIPDAAKCRFYPKCDRSDCPYFHPTIDCPYFARGCKFGSSCIYKHPLCKYDAKCTNIKCPYQHTVQFKPALAVPLCKFGAQCKNAHCTYLHKPVKRSSVTIDRNAAKSIPCKFDPNCTNLHCPYKHESRKLDDNKQVVQQKSDSHHDVNQSITQLDNSLPKTPQHDT